MVDFIGNLSIEAILGFLILCFGIFFVFVLIKQKNGSKKKVIIKKPINQEENKIIKDETRKTNSLNLVDNKSTAIGGIIASQEKKQNRVVKQNKPIGWISAKSYGEDAKNLNIAKYVPFGDTIISEKKDLTNKEKKQQIIILAVDDSITILKYISNIFNGSNTYSLLLKDSAQAGLDYLNKTEEKPSIIISDLNMPGMDGKTFINKIKENENFKNIPIIVLAKTPIEAMPLIESKVVNGVLPKPFSKEDLINQIDFIL